jgi:hypothetical protein
MVQIGDSPILWHIMKTYSTCGIRHFVICLGYKGCMIKEYFANYFLDRADVTFDIAVASQDVNVRNPNAIRPWQNILEPLLGYLLLAELLYGGSPAAVGAFNFGPAGEDTSSVSRVVQKFGQLWGPKQAGNSMAVNINTRQVFSASIPPKRARTWLAATVASDSNAGADRRMV